MQQNDSFGEWLRQRRRVLDLTQDEVARRAGCSVSTVRKMEADERRPSLQVARLLADALAIADEDRAAFLSAARTVTGQAPSTFSRPAHRDDQGLPPGATPGHRHAAPASAPVAASFFPGALPATLNSFVGRQRELAAVCALLERQPPARLVTLTGPGGSGKTRLALECARALRAGFPAGIGWVELGMLMESDLVPQAVAAALGIKEAAPTPLQVTLATHLRDHRFLLILDNCEHLLQACAELVAGLLARCPMLQILATSRELLQLPGEQVFHVPPLALPQTADAQDTVGLQRFESVRLLVERAQAVRRDFALTSANGAAVAEICRRLDGIPLALELAATRLRSLTPEQMADRLDDRFRLLTGGGRVALPRQQTLHSLIAWSYDLLGPLEQALFRRLAVFAGGCTLEAAEAICAFAPLERHDTVDLMTSLVDKSLIGLREEGTDMRYLFLETIREFAHERLALAGEEETLRARHCACFLELAEESSEIIFAERDQAVWLRRLQRDQDNLRAALEWSLTAAPNRALQLAGALWPFWNETDQIMEGHNWLQRALDCADGTAPVAHRARSISGLGTMLYRRNEFPQSATLHQEALALFRTVGDLRGEALSLNNWGAQATLQGDYATAVPLLLQCLEIAQRTGEDHFQFMANCNLGLNYAYAGQLDAAATSLAAGLAAARRTDNPKSIGTILHNLGELALRQGDAALAQSCFDQSGAYFGQIDSKLGVGVNAWGSGVALFRQGEIDAAIAAFQRALVDLAAAASRMHVVDALEWLAIALHAAGRAQPAVRLLGAAAALRQEMGYQIVAAMTQESFDAATAELRLVCGEPGFQAAWTAGATLTMAQAIDYAVSLGSCQEPGA